MLQSTPGKLGLGSLGGGSGLANSEVSKVGIVPKLPLEKTLRELYCVGSLMPRPVILTMALFHRRHAAQQPIQADNGRR
jgi:hypothetical protein